MSEALSPNASAAAVQTRFGSFAANPEDVVCFPSGLPGFERCRQFVLIGAEEIAPFRCLHGLDAPRPSFLVVEPTLAFARYRRVLGQADRLRLDVQADDTLLWLAVVSIGPDGAMVNLRAPLVVNPRNMLGCQVMPRRSLYPLAHPLGA